MSPLKRVYNMTKKFKHASLGLTRHRIIIVTSHFIEKDVVVFDAVGFFSHCVAWL